MNFRLLYPVGYDPNYEPGYPMIVMMHGAGERGNCWNTDCYYKLNAQNAPPWIPINEPGQGGSPPISVNNRNNLLNNDHNLALGGLNHLNAVNLAGSKKPDDPTLHYRAFPGFVLTPQNLNGWNTADRTDAVRLIRLILREFNIDENRIYQHGLSDGARGVYFNLNNGAWLFSAAAPMSGTDAGSIFGTQQKQNALDVSIWTFQGGTDTKPTPQHTVNQIVTPFRALGGDIRYTLYPNLGHGTWNNAYAEPDFFTFFLTKNKANIHVDFNYPVICSTTGQGVNLRVGKGFRAYQWEFDGEIIPGATTHLYTATLPGTYRVRFSRQSANPTTEEQWNRWSDPVTVTDLAEPKPVVRSMFTNHTPAFTYDPSTILWRQHRELTTDAVAPHYSWYRNGNLLTGWTDQQTIFPNGSTHSNPNLNQSSGAYTLITTNDAGCPSPPSDPIHLWMNPNTTPNTTMVPPANFTGYALSPTSIFLSWTDNTPNEKNFEIWRKTATENFTFVGLVNEDVVSFIDTVLLPNTSYHYKIRAVNDNGYSPYIPGSTFHDNLVIATLGDGTPPTPPQNLTVTSNSPSTITLSWDPAIDVSGIKNYKVYYGGNSIDNIPGTSSSYTIQGLTINTVYPIRVTAFDNAMNESQPSNQVIGTTYVEGLYYELSEGNFSSLGFTSLGEEVDWNTYEYFGKVDKFSLSPRIQDDFFRFKFYGYILLPQSRYYQFRITSDDGSMLYLSPANETGFDPNDLTQYRIINNDGEKLNGATTANTNNNGTFYNAGLYKITCIYFERLEGESLLVEWRSKMNSGSSGWPSYAEIPPSMLKSGDYVPPTAPAAPNTLAALANGMTQIDLSWNYGGPGGHQFEVYRSLSSNGTYQMVSRVSSMAYSDINLNPNTTYFYKLKTVSTVSSSNFSSVFSATTASDAVAPSVPSGVALLSKTYTSVSFDWTASTDNVGVAGYEIRINGVIADSTANRNYLATGLQPNTAYAFTVYAYDVSGNKSAASSVLNVTTSTPTIFYSKAAPLPLYALNTWGDHPSGNGSGNAPANFNYNGQYLVVSNRTTSSLGGAWNVSGAISKVIVPDGVTLTVDNNFTGNVEIQGSGIVNMNNAVVPNLVAISPTATVNYNNSNSIKKAAYGNLNINLAGAIQFEAGETVVNGNLGIVAGASLRGISGNVSTLKVGGNVTIAGAPAVTPADNALDLQFIGASPKIISVGSGELSFYKISTTANLSLVSSGGSPVELSVGSVNGGGLLLSNGTTFTLGTNKLTTKWNSTINPNNETGALGFTGGALDLRSMSSQGSNLYFDATNNTIDEFTSNLSSSGNATVRSAVKIASGLKIKAGTLNSDGNITLLSSASKTANLQRIETNGNIIGDVHVQRHIPVVGRVYRYFSVPVEGITVADIQAYTPVTGEFTGTSTGPGLTTNPSMFRYDETQGGWIPFPPPGSSNQVELERGVGYSIFLRNGTAPQNAVYTGNPYQGNIPFTLTGGTGGGANDGWNLLGNPYASTIVWNNTNWSRSGLGSTISVRDNSLPGGGGFQYWDANTGTGSLPGGKIAPGQSFWVQAINASPSLTITEAAKVDDQAILYREGPQSTEYFTVRVNQGEKTDPAFIVLTGNGTDSFDAELDALKQQNSFYNFSSLSEDNISLAINNMSESFCSKVIKLNIQDALPGDYTISFENTDALSNVKSLTLTDHFTGSVTEVLAGTIYSFQITTDPASTGNSRFEVGLERYPVYLDNPVLAEDICGTNTSTVEIKISGSQVGVLYSAINTEGGIVSNIVAGNGDAIVLTVPAGNLSGGENTLSVKAAVGQCQEQQLNKTVTFVYNQKPVVYSEAPLVTCFAETVDLYATGAPEGGSYRWYSGDLTFTGVTDPIFTISSLREEKTYFVSAVSATGCEGDIVAVYATPNQLETPEVSLDKDTLYVTGFGDVQWYLDGVAIAGAQSNYIVPTTSGLYVAQVSYGGCAAFSSPFEHLVTALEGNQVNGFSITVFPNPTNQEDINIMVQSKNSDKIELQLIDILGKVVYHSTLIPDAGTSQFQINPGNYLPSGLYFIDAKQNGVIVRKKVMIKD